ncbi:MAG: type II toxin-antitoxin system CcdA family antitoxin [Pseudomonadota bacterium]
MRLLYAHQEVEMLQSNAKPQRKSVNTSIDSKLIEEAKALGINMSRAAEQGIAKAISAEKTRRWQEENKAAIESSNDYVKRNGLPLAKYRLF